MAAVADAAPELASAEQIRAQQARAVHQQVPASLVGGLIILAVAVGLFHGRVDGFRLYSWAALVFTCSTLRWLSYRGVRTTLANDAVALRWLDSTVVLLSGSALVWGSGLAIFLRIDDPLQVALVFCLTTALAAGAVVPLATYAKCFFAYASCLVLPVALVFFFSGDFTYQLIGIGLTLFVLVNFRYARNVEASMIALFRSEYENELLIGNLSLQHQELVKHRNEAVRQAEIANSANQARSRFVAAASHDLAQPLHSLGLFLDSLRHEMKATGTKAGELLARAEECAANMAGMFSSLLDISRIESGGVELKREDIPLETLLAPVVDDMLAQFEKGPVRFDVDIAPANINTDAEAFQRIVRNLLSNARKFTDKGAVRLSARPEAELVTVEVADSGVGIAEHELSHIFDGYYRVSNGDAPRKAGLGLGLSIVSRFCERLDISIHVESETGVGSTFVLRVPRAAGTTAEPAHDGRLLSPGLDQLPLLVVIDDDRDVRDSISAMLAPAASHKHIVVRSSAEAIGVLHERDSAPGFIISDYDLADAENGLDAINAIREEFNSDVPALIMTGHRTDAVFRRLDDQGIATLIKPFSGKVFLTAIFEQLNGGAYSDSGA